jgi:putative FmdB family regulatory protein
MPIYAFACNACGHHFDKLQKLSDPDPEVCPACGASGQLSRQLTAPSFRLSGSGWYETDFKKEGDKKRNLAGEGGEGAKPSAEAKPAPAKPDTAPATSAPAKPASKSTTSGAD